MKSILLLSIFSSSLVFASVSSPMSSVRDPRIPYEQYMEEAGQGSKVFGTALNVARVYDPAAVIEVAQWDSMPVAIENFKTMRDDRFLGQDHQRRIPWLYPDDGCYARAALMNSWFVNHKITSPSKVFAFGKLSAHQDTLDHDVYWWYHVAPIVQIAGEKYVLDPSVDATGPMKLQTWLDKIGDPKDIKVSVCKPGTYQPGDLCNDETIGVPSPATTNELLDDEWWLVKNNGKDPKKLLGDEPPWE